MREKYPVMDTNELATLLGRSRNSVVIKANRIGIQKPKHAQNDSYFECIDDSTTAYWIGFITADGYVNNSQAYRNYELGIELSTKDEAHLKRFLEDISSNSKVSRRTKSSFKNKGYDKSYEESVARIYSKQIVESLSKYGIVQNKTYSIKFPDNVPELYIWDYVRGFFDGDGSVFVKNVESTNGTIHQYLNVNFTSHSKEFLEGLKNTLFNYDINSTIYKDGNNYQLYIRKQEDILSFFNLIYHKENIRKLDRKHIIFVNYYSEKLPA